MTLHPALLSDMLQDEVSAARVRLGSRTAGLELKGHNVICTLEGTNVGTALLRLDARDYDAEPMAFAVVQPDGTIAKEIMIDFLHPTAKGYQIWADAMHDKLDEMLK